MSPRNAQYKAYSVATRTVAKTRQIVMLYDGALKFIRQAKDAIVEKRIEDRFHLLRRAADIMVGLQNSIDFENGGEVAHTLHRFYTDMSIRILSVNLHKEQGIALCDAVIGDLRQMRDVWDGIDRALSMQQPVAPVMPPAPAPVPPAVATSASGTFSA